MFPPQAVRELGLSACGRFRVEGLGFFFGWGSGWWLLAYGDRASDLGYASGL